MSGISLSSTRANTVLLKAASCAVLLAFCVALPIAGDVNHIVMRVNEHIATLYDYERRKAELASEVEAQPNSPRSQMLMENLPGEVLSNLFQEMLLLSRAQQLNIHISPEEIREATVQARQGMGVPDEASFLEAIRQAGFTSETFRQQMETNLQLQAVIGQEVRPRIRLEEEDLRRYYSKYPDQFRVPETVQVREVVVLESSSLGEAELQELAGKIRAAAAEAGGLTEGLEQVDAGDAVSSVIDLGWIAEGDLDDSLQGAVWTLPVGEVSQPVAARGGLHILEVADRRVASKRKFAEVADAIQRQEGSRKFQVEMRRYLKELEAKAYVRLNLPEEAEGFQFGDGRTYSRDALDQFKDVFTNPGSEPPAGEEEAPESSEDVASAAETAPSD